MQKICEICGESYEASRSNQKYCPECGKNPQKISKDYDAAVRANKKHAGDYDRPRERICEQCGKTFLSLYSRRFCSDSCQREHIAQTATCTTCGRRLIDLGIRRERAGIAFCSEACREKHKKDLREAREKARAESEPKQVPGTETLRCLVCHKLFQRPISKDPYVCSDSCKETFLRRQQERRRRAELETLKEARRSGKARRKGEGIVSLCAGCKTNYPDCRWVSSGYSAYPIGARVQGGNVLSCPEYRGRGA